MNMSSIRESLPCSNRTARQWDSGMAPSSTGASILPMIRDHVVPGSAIFTDEYVVYQGITTMQQPDGSPMGFRHGTELDWRKYPADDSGPRCAGERDIHR